MADYFGNNRQDGYSATPYVYSPKWERQVDFNPDHQPSSSRLIVTERNDDARHVLMVLQVRGLGVITLHSFADEFVGVGVLTKGDIGYSPEL